MSPLSHGTGVTTLRGKLKVQSYLGHSIYDGMSHKIKCKTTSQNSKLIMNGI